MSDIVPIEKITSKIYVIRDTRVMLDRDLAELYGVKTKALKQAVRRNIARFPEDFMFELTKEKFRNWRSQFVTSIASPSPRATDCVTAAGDIKPDALRFLSFFQILITWVYLRFAWDESVFLFILTNGFLEKLQESLCIFRGGNDPCMNLSFFILIKGLVKAQNEDR